MPADVFFWALPDRPGSELAPPDPRLGLRRLVAALGCEGAARTGPGWALKVHLGPPGRPAAIAPAWAQDVAAALGGPAAGGGARAPAPAGAFATDNLSITTRGLETASALRETARVKGFGAGTGSLAPGLPFVVGDDPEGPPDLPLAPPPGTSLSGHALAGALAMAGGLALLNPVRPHPHLGVAGVVAGLGLDLAGRDAKLRLHRGIRPRVDTPLCAGCGSCLDVCLYDAIVIRGGRAVIDHEHCTGCGECMGVCFMAGIAPEETEGIAAFQGAVAEAAAAAAAHLARDPARPPLYLNFLIQLNAPAKAAKARRRLPLAGVGIVASRDPVAADAAAIDLLAGRLDGSLSQWSGFVQSPGPLLDRAEALGLGSREYRLREV